MRVAPPSRRFSQRTVSKSGPRTRTRPKKHGAGQYVDLNDRTIHTNTIEGYFSIFKRGMRGVYQHCGEQHLHRYLAEFEFRYNNRVPNGFDDRERANNALAGIVGKRLTYARPDGLDA